MASERSGQGEYGQRHRHDLRGLESGGAGIALHGGVRVRCDWGEVAGFFVSRRSKRYNEGEMRAQD